MDDGSPADGTGAAIRLEFPEVRYYALGCGKGPTFQRNRGAELAKAEILVTLDDDCVLSDPGVIERIFPFFTRSDIAGVTLPFVNVLSGDQQIWCNAPSNDGLYRTHEFYGGMVALRRSAFLAVGGYREAIFMQCEEGELATRLHANGFLIICGYGKCIDHFESPVRDTRKLQYLGARNAIYCIWFNTPGVLIPLHASRSCFLSIRQGFRLHQPAIAFRGVLDGLSGVFRCWRWRRPVPLRVYLDIQALRRVRRKMIAVARKPEAAS